MQTHVALWFYMITIFLTSPWWLKTEWMHRENSQNAAQPAEGSGGVGRLCCTHIGNNDHLIHRLHKNYVALQSLFQTFQRVHCFADSSLNPTVPQHFNEIRTWHRKLLMWIRWYLSSISNIKDILSFYFFLKALFIWTLRDNIQLHHMLLNSHSEFWHWITNSSWSIIGSCGFTSSHRSISIFLSLLYKTHAHNHVNCFCPTTSSPVAQSVKCHNLVIPFVYTTHYSFEDTPEVVKQPLS